MRVELTNVAAALKVARRRVRLSQTAVGDYLGSARQTVAAFENGERQPVFADALKLANLYRVSLDKLASVRHSSSRKALDVLPRFEGDGNLSAADRAELESFDKYLETRPPSSIQFPTRSRYESVADTADRVRAASKVSEPPVPIEALVGSCGIEVRFTPLDELAGALLLPSASGRPYGILVNSDQPRERERFTIAHELGHLLLGHPDLRGEGAFVDYIGRRFMPVEVQADMFAAELLVPAAMLRQRLAKIAPDEPVEFGVYRLAAEFLVSFQAMTARLDKLGVLLPEDIERLRKTKPSDVAKKLGRPKRATRGLPPKQLGAFVADVLKSDAPPSADTVRLVQDAVLSRYAAQVPEWERAETPTSIYEKVAVWIADRYPLYET